MYAYVQRNWGKLIPQCDFCSDEQAVYQSIGSSACIGCKSQYFQLIQGGGVKREREEEDETLRLAMLPPEQLAQRLEYLKGKDLINITSNQKLVELAIRQRQRVFFSKQYRLQNPPPASFASFGPFLINILLPYPTLIPLIISTCTALEILQIGVSSYTQEEIDLLAQCTSLRELTLPVKITTTDILGLKLPKIEKLKLYDGGRRHDPEVKFFFDIGPCENLRELSLDFDSEDNTLVEGGEARPHSIGILGLDNKPQFKKLTLTGFTRYYIEQLPLIASQLTYLHLALDTLEPVRGLIFSKCTEINFKLFDYVRWGHKNTFPALESIRLDDQIKPDILRRDDIPQEQVFDNTLALGSNILPNTLEKLKVYLTTYRYAEIPEDIPPKLTSVYSPLHLSIAVNATKRFDMLGFDGDTVALKPDTFRYCTILDVSTKLAEPLNMTDTAFFGSFNRGQLKSLTLKRAKDFIRGPVRVSAMKNILTSSLKTLFLVECNSIYLDNGNAFKHCPNLQILVFIDVVDITGEIDVIPTKLNFLKISVLRFGLVDFSGCAKQTETMGGALQHVDFSGNFIGINYPFVPESDLNYWGDIQSEERTRAYAYAVNLRRRYFVFTPDSKFRLPSFIK